MTDDVAALAERVAFRLSTKLVRECVASLRSADDWTISRNGGAHRVKPYPMGFYLTDANLYYARGWGCSKRMWPHERWLVLRTAALRQHLERHSND